MYMYLYHGTEFALLCDVASLSEGIHILLGMDFLMKVNEEFSFDAININMNHMSTNHQVEGKFAFNHNKGSHLMNKLKSLGYEIIEEHLSLIDGKNSSRNSEIITI